MTRNNWTTTTVGRANGYSIAGRAFLFIVLLCCVLTLAWAASNQTIIR